MELENWNLGKPTIRFFFQKSAALQALLVLPMANNKLERQRGQRCGLLEKLNCQKLYRNGHRDLQVARGELRIRWRRKWSLGEEVQVWNILFHCHMVSCFYTAIVLHGFLLTYINPQINDSLGERKSIIAIKRCLLHSHNITNRCFLQFWAIY